MKRLAAVLLIGLGVALCATTQASARPYGWYGYGVPYRAYYGPRVYAPRVYAPRVYGPPIVAPYRAYYPGVSVGVNFGYPGYYYGPPAYYRGPVGPYGYRAW